MAINYVQIIYIQRHSSFCIVALFPSFAPVIKFPSLFSDIKLGVLPACIRKLGGQSHIGFKMVAVTPLKEDFAGVLLMDESCFWTLKHCLEAEDEDQWAIWSFSGKNPTTFALYMLFYSFIDAQGAQTKTQWAAATFKHSLTVSNTWLVFVSIVFVAGQSGGCHLSKNPEQNRLLIIRTKLPLNSTTRCLEWPSELFCSTKGKN